MNATLNAFRHLISAPLDGLAAAQEEGVNRSDGVVVGCNSPVLCMEFANTVSSLNRPRASVGKRAFLNLTTQNCAHLREGERDATVRWCAFKHLDGRSEQSFCNAFGSSGIRYCARDQVSIEVA